MSFGLAGRPIFFSKKIQKKKLGKIVKMCVCGLACAGRGTPPRKFSNSGPNFFWSKFRATKGKFSEKHEYFHKSLSFCPISDPRYTLVAGRTRLRAFPQKKSRKTVRPLLVSRFFKKVLLSTPPPVYKGFRAKNPDQRFYSPPQSSGLRRQHRSCQNSHALVSKTLADGWHASPNSKVDVVGRSACVRWLSLARSYVYTDFYIVRFTPGGASASLFAICAT